MAPKPCAKYEYVAGKIIPVLDQECKDEESPADYNPGGYLPVNVGDSFKHGRYVVLRKLGWGHFSTVWLVRDVLSNRHSALKVVKSAGRYAETAIDEIKLLSHIAAVSPAHPGRSHIVSFLDSFSHVPLSSSLSQSPTHSLSTRSESAHVCIVFEPLGENLLSLISRHKQKGVPRALVKYIAKQILLGLQYLHDECGLIHTDIKPENILIQIPDVESHIHSQLTSCPSPTSRRVALPPPFRSHKSARNGVAIPQTRERLRERREVQIFDSQPLGSPVLSGSYGSGLATSLPVASNLAASRPVVKRTATAIDHLASPSISTSSSSSSLASASASGSTPAASSVISTPPTSVSLGYGFGIGMVSIAKNKNMSSIDEGREKKPTKESAKEGKLNENIHSQLHSAMSSNLPTSISPPSPSASSSSKATDATKRPIPTAPKMIIVKDPLPMRTKAKPKIGIMGGTGVPAPAVVSVNAVSVSPSQSGFAGPTTTTTTTTNSALQASSLSVTFIPESPTNPSLASTASHSPTPIPTPLAPPNPGPSLLSQIRPRHVNVTPCTNDGATSTSQRASSSSSSLTPTPTSPSAPPPTPCSASPSPLHSELSCPQVAAPELDPPPLPIQIKIADMGNATPVSRHFTDEIQTRQYRAPEAILGRKDWGCKVDVWSLGCLVFELLTAEYLFDPQGHGEVFSKDDDHMAQIIELLDDFPLELKMGGRFSRDLFDNEGKLRFIAKLKKWPLRRVMVEKYLWNEEDTKAFCDFLEMMLVIDWKKRKGAGECVKSEWLEVKPEDWGEGAY